MPRPAMERKHRRRLGPWKQPADRGQRLRRRVEHDIFRVASAEHPLDPAQKPLSAVALDLGHGLACPNEHRLALEHGLDRFQPIGLERRAGRNQVADRARNPQPRCKLDRSVHLDHFGGDPALGKPRPEHAGIAGRDPTTGKALDPLPLLRLGDRELERAPPEPERGDHFAALGPFGQREFLQNIFADDPPFADPVGDEGRNVVVANEHQVGGEILDPRGQAVLAVGDPQPGIGKQPARLVAQPSRLLDRDVKPLAVDQHGACSFASASIAAR